MNQTSRIGMRLLKTYVFVAASLLIVLALAAFRNAPQTRFEEIDVERLNVVEKDGKVKLIVSNKARFPGLMIEGKEHPFPRGVAGIVLIDDQGTEYRTLTTQTRREAERFEAYSGLRFGNAGQGQTVGMIYTMTMGSAKRDSTSRTPPPRRLRSCWSKARRCSRCRTARPRRAQWPTCAGRQAPSAWWWQR